MSDAELWRRRAPARPGGGRGGRRARCGERGARWLDDVRHRRLGDRRQRPRRRRSRGPGGRRGARRRDGGDARRPRAGREEQLAAALGPSICTACCRAQAPFRWEGDHIAAEVNGARALFTTRRGGVSTGPFASLNLGRLTADDAPTSTRTAPASPRPPVPARALPLRQAGPRRHRAARHRAPGPQRRPRGGRPGDRARPGIRRSSSSPTARPCCSSPTAPSRRCTAAGAGPRPASSPRASRRCASPARRARR